MKTRWALLLAGALTIASLAAPALADPPPWAPAHGKKGKHQYKYYPDAQAYFDPSRSLYFFLENGKWVSKALLPPPLQKVALEPVFLDMDIPTPFDFHNEIIKAFPSKIPLPPLLIPPLLPPILIPPLPGVRPTTVPVPVPVPVPVQVHDGDRRDHDRDRRDHDRDRHDDDRDHDRDRHKDKGKHKGNKHRD